VRLSDVLGLDLLAAANAKIDRNEHRFPRLTNQGAINREP
jgi:hypothetical protein